LDKITGKIKKHLAHPFPTAVSPLRFMERLTSTNKYYSSYMALTFGKDKIQLRNRSILETINNELKNRCRIEHSPHRSPANFLSNLLAGWVACSFFSIKPAVKYAPAHSNRLA
tara:strand:- start:227 stop:565 length:339 start_codon:yes stop_codon:yes gene_type:complete